MFQTDVAGAYVVAKVMRSDIDMFASFGFGFFTCYQHLTEVVDVE